MVEFQPSKLVAWVRFPSLSPIRALSSVDRVPGYEPVGRRFESSRARQQKRLPSGGLFCCLCPTRFEPCTRSVRRFAYRLRYPAKCGLTEPTGGAIQRNKHPHRRTLQGAAPIRESFLLLVSYEIRALHTKCAKVCIHFYIN